MGISVVGFDKYGTQDGQDYWIGRPAKGTDWGDNGYILLERGTDIKGNSLSTCGLLSNPTKPNFGGF